jgi:hypothetical protein
MALGSHTPEGRAREAVCLEKFPSKLGRPPINFAAPTLDRQVRPCGLPFEDICQTGRAAVAMRSCLLTPWALH